MTFVHARHETTAPAKSVAWVSTTEELVEISGPIGSNGADGGKGGAGTRTAFTLAIPEKTNFIHTIFHTEIDRQRLVRSMTGEAPLRGGPKRQLGSDPCTRTSYPCSPAPWPDIPCDGMQKEDGTHLV